MTVVVRVEGLTVPKPWVVVRHIHPPMLLLAPVRRPAEAVGVLSIRLFSCR